METYKFAWSQNDYPDETFQFWDIVSLYPSVAAFTDFPVGPPEIWIGPELTDVQFNDHKLCKKGQQLHGLANVVVYPPLKCDRPILSFKVGDIRAYSLCPVCTKEKSSTPCKHPKSKRQWQETYCIEEIEYAHSIGYTFDILEIYNYSHLKPIFRDFVQILALEKIKSSEMPKIDVNAFCANINSGLVGERFCLKPEEIHPNLCRRNFYKLLLNSLLGKLAQSQIGLIDFQFVSNYDEINILQKSKQYDMVNIDVLNEAKAIVYVRKKKRQPTNVLQWKQHFICLNYRKS